MYVIYMGKKRNKGENHGRNEDQEPRSFGMLIYEKF